MSTSSLKLTLAGLTLAASALSAQSAQAHIDMLGALKSRGGNQKLSPCDGKRGDGPVYEFEPGATITLGVSEYVPHPSYYRIAFDNDGDDSFVEPASIKPIEPARKCPYDADDQCGKSDFCNVVSSDGASVLWDNLNPHPSGLPTTVSWNVKLPDVECDNCTLQVIQVMEDVVHGAYCPQGSCKNSSKSLEDIYHRCIDIKLVKGAKGTTGVTKDPVKNMGMECAKEAPPTQPIDPETRVDAGSSEEPDGQSGDRDAGTATDDNEEEQSDDEPTGSSNTGKKDAGKTSVKKDAGSTSSDDDEPSASTDDSGCAVASSSRSMAGAGWSALALAGLLVRRRRALRTRV